MPAQLKSPVVAWCQESVNLRTTKTCGEGCSILRKELSKFSNCGFLPLETLKHSSRILELKDPWHCRINLWCHHIVTMSFNDHGENLKWRVLACFCEQCATVFAYIPHETRGWSLLKHITQEKWYYFVQSIDFFCTQWVSKSFCDKLPVFLGNWDVWGVRWIQEAIPLMESVGEWPVEC